MEMTGLISQMALFTLCPLSLSVSSVHFYLSSHSPASFLMTQMWIFIKCAVVVNIKNTLTAFKLLRFQLTQPVSLNCQIRRDAVYQNLMIH